VNTTWHCFVLVQLLHAGPVGHAMGGRPLATSTRVALSNQRSCRRFMLPSRKQPPPGCRNPFPSSCATGHEPILTRRGPPPRFARMRPTDAERPYNYMQKPSSFCLADVCTALHCDFFTAFVAGHVGYGFDGDAPCRQAIVEKHRRLCEVRLSGQCTRRSSPQLDRHECSGQALVKEHRRLCEVRPHGRGPTAAA